MRAYYNEFDKSAASWLRELISDGLIAPGDVDERSIIDVDYKDLEGYTQYHFFAGIGGWSYALRLSQWPDNKPVWTASLPCQPFSTAGKQLGKQDERHLLPHFLELVKQCKPNTIFGEQVERAIGHGWLDDLQTTMEAEGYSVGHVVLGAHSIGAAHIRQRLYWVADSASAGGCWRESLGGRRYSESRGSSEDCGLGISNCAGSQQRIEAAKATRYWCSSESAGDANGMADSFGIECTEQGNGRRDKEGARSSGGTNAHGGEHESIEWIYCRDGKYRPIESGLKPLVDGVSRGMVHSSDPRNTQEARVMRLKGYGNAIVPQVAAEFISAFMDTQIFCERHQITKVLCIECERIAKHAQQECCLIKEEK